MGASSVLQLAKQHPSKIYFTGRDETRGESIAADVKSTAPNVEISFLKADLTSLDSVKAAFDQFASNRLDILMCNAGIMANPPALTKDGYELQFGVNYLAHALLVKLFLPLLLETAKLPNADVRVVMLTSVAYQSAPAQGIQFDRLKTTMDGGPMAKWARYGQSKLADALLASELAARYPLIQSLAVHPGFVSTGLNTNASWSSKVVVQMVRTLLYRAEMIEQEEGCYNQIWAACGSKEGVVNGGFYEPVGVLTKTSSKPRSNKDLSAKLSVSHSPTIIYLAQYRY